MAELTMSRSMGINGRGAIRGEVKLPGDKSISHRVAMLAGIAQGRSRIRNFASSADCHATLECVRRLGIRVESDDGEIIIYGKGLRGMTPVAFPVEPEARTPGPPTRVS